MSAGKIHIELLVSPMEGAYMTPYGPYEGAGLTFD